MTNVFDLFIGFPSKLIQSPNKYTTKTLKDTCIKKLDYALGVHLLITILHSIVNTTGGGPMYLGKKSMNMHFR